jgi:hypothetical protein
LLITFVYVFFVPVILLHNFLMISQELLSIRELSAFAIQLMLQALNLVLESVNCILLPDDLAV